MFCRMLVLKAKHSLTGKSPFPLLKAVRQAATPPTDWASLKRDHALDAYSEDQLVEAIKKLTGCSTSDLLEALGKVQSQDVLLLILHHVILLANEIGQPRGTPLVETGSGGPDGEDTPRPKRPLASETTSSVPEKHIREEVHCPPVLSCELMIAWSS